MFDAAHRIARFSFPNHFARRHGPRCTGAPKPSRREKVICLVCNFFRRLEGHFQTRFHLHDFIGKGLKFARLFVVPMRHEDAEFVFRESAQHRLDFWKMDRLLSSSPRLQQITGASL